MNSNMRPTYCTCFQISTRRHPPTPTPCFRLHPGHFLSWKRPITSLPFHTHPPFPVFFLSFSLLASHYIARGKGGGRERSGEQGVIRKKSSSVVNVIYLHLQDDHLFVVQYPFFCTYTPCIDGGIDFPTAGRKDPPPPPSLPPPPPPPPPPPSFSPVSKKTLQRRVK